MQCESILSRFWTTGSEPNGLLESVNVLCNTAATLVEIIIYEQIAIGNSYV